MGKLLTGEKLLKKAKKLNVNTEGDLITQSANGRRPVADEATLQRRVMEAENHRRQKWSLFMSIIAAIASALSAGFSWAAYFSK